MDNNTSWLYCEDEESVQQDVTKLQNILSSLNEGNTNEVKYKIENLVPVIKTESITDSLEEEIYLQHISNNEDAKTAIEMCLKLKKKYYSQMCLLEKNMIDLHIENKRESQNNVLHIQTYQEIKKKPPCLTSIRGTWCSMFRAPFFKDQQLFPSPPNKDSLERKEKGYFSSIDLPPTRVWKEEDKLKLETIIKASEREARIKQAKRMQNLIRNNVLKCKDPFIESELKLKLKKCRDYITKIKKMELPDLVKLKSIEYDWLKISAVDFVGIHSAEECSAMWYNYLHPNINKKEWTKDEDNRLYALAAKHKYQDWAKIAEELNTQRSAYQCICHYQRHLNKDMKKNKWTQEEDKALQTIVQRFRRGNFIPWAKVAYYMEGRTKIQAYNRWCYSLNPAIRKGRFTRKEDILIIAGIRKFGRDFRQIAKFLHGRTSVQIRDRFNTCLKYQKPSGPWTTEEDSILLEQVQKYGKGNWRMISQHFYNRNRIQIRHRYNTLQKWINKNPGQKLPNVSNSQISTINTDIGGPEKIWEDVQTILRKKKINCIKNENHELVVDVLGLHELKEKLGLGERKKIGRKVGSKKIIGAIEKEYNHFFQCAYKQHGGRRKLNYEPFEIQILSNLMEPMLHALMAELKIPPDSILMKDDSLVEMDKYILQFLRDKKVKEQKKSAQLSNNIDDKGKPSPNSTVNFKSVSSDQVLETLSEVNTTFYNYPPTHTTLVGLRTLLLSHRNLVHNVNQYGTDNTDTNMELTNNVSLVQDTLQGNDAVTQWKKRFASLFTWPLIMSNNTPKLMDELFPEGEISIASSSNFDDDKTKTTEKDMFTQNETMGNNEAPKIKKQKMSKELNMKTTTQLDGIYINEKSKVINQESKKGSSAVVQMDTTEGIRKSLRNVPIIYYKE